MSEPGLFQAFREGANKSDQEITARWFRFFSFCSPFGATIQYLNPWNRPFRAQTNKNHPESPLGLNPVFCFRGQKILNLTGNNGFTFSLGNLG